MRTRLLLAGTALITGALFAATPAAQAEPYPAGDPALTSSTALVGAGGAVQLSGSGYGPNDDVSIDAVYASSLGHFGRSVPGQFRRFPVGSATANANGDWSTTITLEQTGVATITATGAPSGVQRTTIVRVVSDLPLEDGDGGGGEDGLPITGTRLTTAIVLGTVTVVVGAVLLWLPIALRRRGRHSDGAA
jgi:hypothetical protein